MRFVRYVIGNEAPRYGWVHEDWIGAVEGVPYGEYRRLEAQVPLHAVRLLAPVQPGKIICVGRNYPEHAREQNVEVPEIPLLFMKPPSAVIGPGENIMLPPQSRQVEHEGELAVVIGRAGRWIAVEEALDYVFGYTCANDVSARDWQGPWGGSQWCRGKTFDTFAPLGPCLVLKDEIPDPAALKLRTLLNGQVMQDWRCDDMLFDVPTLISFLSGSTTLLPGTVILTGTPHGVGFARKPPVFLQPGDRVTIEIDRIGALTNPVVEEGGEFPPPRTPRRDPAG